MWLVACVSGCWCTVLVCAQCSHMPVCINWSMLWVNGVIAAVQWIGWKSSCVQHYIDLLCVYVRVCACVCSLAVSGLYNRGPSMVIVFNRGCWSAAADWPFTLRLQPEVNLRGVCHQIRVKMMIQRSWLCFGKIMLCKKKQILCCPSRRFWSGVETCLCLAPHWIKMCLVKIFKLANQVVLWRQTNAQDDRRSTSSKLSRKFPRSTVGSNQLFQSGLCSTICVYVSKCQIMLTECLLASRVKKQPNPSLYMVVYCIYSPVIGIGSLYVEKKQVWS